jgi:hypothetical protein
VLAHTTHNKKTDRTSRWRSKNPAVSLGILVDRLQLPIRLSKQPRTLQNIPIHLAKSSRICNHATTARMFIRHRQNSRSNSIILLGGGESGGTELAAMLGQAERRARLDHKIPKMGHDLLESMRLIAALKRLAQEVC